MSLPSPKKRGLCAFITRKLSKYARFKSPAYPPGSLNATNIPKDNDIFPAPSTCPLPPESSYGSGPAATTIVPDNPNTPSVQSSVLNGLINALRILSKYTAIFPPLQGAVEGLIVCFDTTTLGLKNDRENMEIVASLLSLTTSLTQHLQESQSARLSEFIERMSISLNEQIDIIIKKQHNVAGTHLVQAHRDQDQIVDAYRRIERLFRQLQCDAALSMWNTVDEHLANTRLEALLPSKQATYNSMLALEINRRACTKDTRVQLLLKLDQWSLDTDAPNIYWMNGMAGTGKTTIAYTFSESLRARKSLGASFFCSRSLGECRDVGRIIPTIAYQLARYSRSFQVALTRILGNDPDIGSQTISHQFERLIKEPLASVKNAVPAGLVIVIDALDECSNTKGVEMILDLLFRIATSLQLKFFVTSRPEPSVYSRVQAQSNKTRLLFVLHDIESSLVQADIEIFLQEELSSDMVSKTQLKQLAELAGNLFIYAATAIRYIRRAGGQVDQKRLGIVLSSSTGTSHKYAEVDHLYTSILTEAIHYSGLEVSEKEQIKRVLWAVLCVREPIAINTLSEIIGSTAVDVETALRPLFSVLHISEATNTVSTLHASFPDFMFDRMRSGRFHCNGPEMHQIIAEYCFEIMKQQLRFNLCGLESSFKYDHEVEGLSARVSKMIGPTLSYVIAYWGDHVAGSAVCEPIESLLQSFLSTRLLFWIEALNLKGTLSSGMSAFSRVKSWSTAIGLSSELVRSLDDCWLFLMRFVGSPMTQSTPHLYISALPFCHHTSSVYKNYWSRTCQLLTLHGSAIGQGQALLATWNMHSVPFSLAFSCDGARFAVGFMDGAISILDTITGVPQLGPLMEHSDYVQSIAFSPDGSFLASCSNDYTIIVRDTSTGAQIYDTIRGHEGRIRSVCFSPDGSSILSGSDDCTTRMWGSRTGKEIPNSLKHYSSPVACATYSPDGKHVACGLDSDERPAVIYTASTGELVHGGLQGHRSPVYSVAFSPDGKSIITGHACGSLCIWSVQDGSLTHGPLKAHKRVVSSVGVSPKGDKLATASYDGSVYLWDAQKGYANPCLLGIHDECVFSAVFSPDGTRVLSCSLDCTVKVWNALYSISSEGKHRKAPSKGVYSVAFSPDGLRIAAASPDHIIYIFSAHDGTLALDPLVAHTDAAYSVTFSPDGRYIASGGDDSAICLWEGITGKLLSSPVRLHTARIWSVSFSPDGMRIVSASEDRTMRLWNVSDSTLTPSNLIAIHDDLVYSASFSPDGKRIASGSGDRRIRIWDSQTLTLVLDPFGPQFHTDDINSVVFSPDGMLVASGSCDRTICVFDSHTGELVLGPLKGHADWVRSVMFSPNGTHIISASDDQTIRVWRVSDGVPVCEPLAGHQGSVWSVAYSPDGALIVSGSSDSTVRLWKSPRSHDHSHASELVSTPLGETELPGGTSIGRMTLSQDGWARNRDSQRLFLVPSDMVKLFPSPETVYTIRSEGVLRADYSTPLFLGDEWHRCYLY